MAAKWLKSIPYLWPKWLKNHTLWRRTYLYSPYRGVPPPPSPGNWTLLDPVFSVGKSSSLQSRSEWRHRRHESFLKGSAFVCSTDVAGSSLSSKSVESAGKLATISINFNIEVKDGPKWKQFSWFKMNECFPGYNLPNQTKFNLMKSASYPWSAVFSLHFIPSLHFTPRGVCSLACVAVVSVSFKPSGASARGHWAKSNKKVGAGGRGGEGKFPFLPRPSPPLLLFFAPFCQMPSRAWPAWLEGNGNDCYAGYLQSAVCILHWPTRR